MAASSSLCAVCLALDFKWLSRPCRKRYATSNLSRAQLHQPSFEHLVTSAKSCVLCAHFLTTWVNCPSRRNANESDEEHKQRIYMLERVNDQAYREPKKAVRKLQLEEDWFTRSLAAFWPQQVRPGEWPPSGLENMLGSFTVRGGVVKGIDHSQGLYGLTLQRIRIVGNMIWMDDDISQNWTNLSCVTDDVPWIAGRPFEAYTAVNLGSKWLAECSKTHTSCGPLKDTELPTRVIDVGQEGAQEPKLIETNGRYGQWVTLSYPWGGAPPITTRSTYDDNLKEMPMVFLPQLFQDAVRVVRAMGFQYLWIDSVCIIQGDVEDWARGCGRMAQFYESSAFTIAACAASSPESSLTSSAGASNSPSCLFEKEGVQFIASLDNMIDHESTPMVPERNSVIATRAWCLQERLLAPRVLYLGSKQPYWECHACRFYAFLRTPLPPTGDRPIFSKAGTHTISKSILSPNKSFKTKSWLDMVESYSRCILTNNMDKLPALSGIVQAATRRTNDKYLAGIWLKELHRGLAWLCDPFQRNIGSVTTGYRAPSWSWASIDEPVIFHWFESLTASYEVMDVTITPATSDPFGRLSGGVLTLSAHIMEMKLTPSMRQPTEEFYDNNNKQLYIDFWPDRSDKSGRKARKLSCLLLGGSFIYGGGLALEKVEGQPKTFRRVGFMYSSSYMSHWRIVGWLRKRHIKKWLKCERQIVHLI